MKKSLSLFLILLMGHAPALLAAGNFCSSLHAGDQLQQSQTGRARVRGSEGTADKEVTIQVFDKTSTQQRLIDDNPASARSSMAIKEGQILRFQDEVYNLEFALPKPLDLAGLKVPDLNQAGKLIESLNVRDVNRGFVLSQTMAKFDGEYLVVERPFVINKSRVSAEIVEARFKFKLITLENGQTAFTEVSIFHKITNRETLTSKEEVQKITLRQPIVLLVKKTPSAQELVGLLDKDYGITAQQVEGYINIVTQKKNTKKNEVVRGSADAFYHLTEIFYAAMKKERTDVLEYLLKIGIPADGNMPEYFPVPPLVSAANGNRLSVVKLLIAYGAKIDKTSEYGVTALIGAAANGHKDVVKVLLEAGADPNFKTENGDTALKRVQKFILNAENRKEIQRLLIEAGARE